MKMKNIFFIGMIIVGVIVLGRIILLFIAQWKLFQKAGIQGWKSLIPVYNMYIMFNIIRRTKRFRISLIVGSVVLIGEGIGIWKMAIAPEIFHGEYVELRANERDGEIGTQNQQYLSKEEKKTTFGKLFLRKSIINALSEGYGYFSLVIWVLFCLRVAKVFGRKEGFGVGLCLLWGIFIPILGFSTKTEYHPELLDKTQRKEE